MTELVAYYERDSEQCSLFSISENEAGIVGSIYVPKNSTIPREVTVRLELVRPGEIYR